MNRRLLFLGASFLATATIQAQATHELTNVGLTFSPALITMNAGDSIHLVLSNPHTCTEVDQATWDANGNAPNGGFNYSAGEHTFALDIPGTYYYVCAVHAGMGMKGKIIVENGSGIQAATDLGSIKLYPNPARNEVRIGGFEPGQSVQVMDAALKLVLEAKPKADGLLDISPLPAGNYNVSVRDAKGQWTVSLPLVVVH